MGFVARKSDCVECKQKKGAPLRDMVVVAFQLILMNRLNQTESVVFKSEHVGSFSF